jgi:hypothetical protein
MTATIAEVRDALAQALEGTGYTVYAYPPPTVIPPAVVIVPAQPYLDFETIGSAGTRMAVRFELIVAVAAIDNQAQLDNLEQITIAVVQALPNGTALEAIDRPTVEQVGPSSLLTVRVPVTVRATLTPTPPPPPPPPAPAPEE